MLPHDKDDSPANPSDDDHIPADRRVSPGEQPPANTARCTASRFALTALTLSVASPGALADPVTVDSTLLENLQRVITRQQQQIEQQSVVLESLQTQLNDLRTDTDQIKSQAASTDTQSITASSAPDAKVVTNVQDNVSLSISGQVNRAINVVDDGKSTDAYFVDNDASNSRIRLVGKARVTDDLTLGTRFEVAVAPNESSKVSQDNPESGDFFDQRWVDLSLASERFGKLYLGKGSTASDNTGEQDLSRTAVVAYSNVSAIAAGMLFRDRNDNFTDIDVGDAFVNFDGLSRRSRLRYDSPDFGGFKVQGSLVSDSRWDGSLWWGGKTDTLRAVAAAAIADPNLDGIKKQYNGSFSVLHQPTGLNLTLSGGFQDAKQGDDPSNVYGKLGWLHQFFPVGDTAFGIDYTQSKNLPDDAYKGTSFGGAVVQAFDKYGTQVYLQLRRYSLDFDDGPDPQDITVGTIGARTKF